MSWKFLNLFSKQKVFTYTGLRSNGKKTYIIPTSAGLFAIALTFYALVAGMVYSNNLVMILGILLLMTTAFCSIMTNFYLHEVQMENFHFQDSHQGGQLTCHLSCQQDSQFENILLKVFLTKEKQKTTHQAQTPASPITQLSFRLIKQDNGRLLYQCEQELARGQYRIEFIQYSTQYPFGLFFSWKTQRIEQTHLFRYPSCKKISSLQIAQPELTDQNKRIKGIDEYHQHTRGNEQQLNGKVDWKRYFGKKEIWLKHFDRPTKERYSINLNRLPHENLEQQLSIVASELKLLAQTGKDWELRSKNKLMTQHQYTELLEESMRELARYES